MMQGGPGSGSVPYRFDPLFIEDPLALGNNVGRNCFRSVATDHMNTYFVVAESRSSLRLSERA